MGSRFFKSLFFGSNNNSSSLKSGSGAYDSTTASEPPVKGSYPVAGNGPNVEETLHRARVKREAKQNEGRPNTGASRIASKRASIIRTQSDTTTQAHAQRPRTAPHNGEPGGFVMADTGDGRTRSGFSMKSPPSFFKRRSSLFSTQSPPEIGPPPPIPTKPVVQAYIPSHGPAPSINPATPSEPLPDFNGYFTPPFAQKQHHRNFSRNSQSSHVDLLDAHSSIVGKESSSVRAKASGLRSYGEDVADRNIAVFGDQKLDLNSSDFGYLKSVYSGRKRQASDGVAQNTSRVSKTDSDDTGPRSNGRPRSSSAFSTGVISPDYASASIGRNENSYSLAPYDHMKRGLPSTTSAKPEAPPKDPRRKDSDPIDFSTLPRGRQVREFNPPVLPPQRLSSLGQIPSQVVSPIEESPRSDSFQQSPRQPHSRHSPAKAMGHHQSRPGSRRNSLTNAPIPNTNLPGSYPKTSQHRDQVSQPRTIGGRQDYSSNAANPASHSSPPAGYSPAFTIKPIPDQYNQQNSFGSQRGTAFPQESTMSNTPRSILSNGMSSKEHELPAQQYSSSPLKPTSNGYKQKESEMPVQLSSSPLQSSTNGSREKNEILSSAPLSNMNGNKKYLVQGATEAPSLNGIVDLTNTFDTEVITKTLPGTYTSPPSVFVARPSSAISTGSSTYSTTRHSIYHSPSLSQLPSAQNTPVHRLSPGMGHLPSRHTVVHEKVLPTRHEIREEKITREIHTHDIFHRVLPIIETEILPTRHYIHSADGKSLIEIPESQIPGRPQYNTEGHWQFIPTPPRQATPVKQQPEQHYRHSSNPVYTDVPEISTRNRRVSSTSQITRKPLPYLANDIDEAAESPVVPFARGESPFPNRPRGRSVKMSSQPVLAEKRESILPDGSFRKEYLWRHAPQYENAIRPGSSRSSITPKYIGAGIGDISQESVTNGSRDLYFSDATTDSENSPDPRKPHDSQDLLFRDSGYGNGGLPGIQTGGAFDANGLVNEFDQMRLGHRKGGSNGKEVLVEREDESDEDGMVEERFRNANREMRKIRVKRSRSDLRLVSQLAAN